jgi:RNA-directed DNA polymerase
VDVSTPARMEEVAERLDLAMKKVVANRGAPGPDGMTLEQRWSSIAPGLRADLLDRSYRPGAIRRVMISKVDGGQRALGIPTRGSTTGGCSC